MSSVNDASPVTDTGNSLLISSPATTTEPYTPNPYVDVNPSVVVSPKPTAACNSTLQTLHAPPHVLANVAENTVTQISPVHVVTGDEATDTASQVPATTGSTKAVAGNAEDIGRPSHVPIRAAAIFVVESNFFVVKERPQRSKNGKS